MRSRAGALIGRTKNQQRCMHHHNQRTPRKHSLSLVLVLSLYLSLRDRQPVTRFAFTFLSVSHIGRALLAARGVGVPSLLLAARTPPPPTAPTSSEHLLRSVRHVQEAVMAAILGVHLGNCAAQRDHRSIVDQQENGLAGRHPHPMPYDGAELRHGELLRCEELALVEQRQVGLFVVALDDDLW